MESGIPGNPEFIAFTNDVADSWKVGIQETLSLSRSLTTLQILGKWVSWKTFVHLQNFFSLFA